MCRKQLSLARQIISLYCTLQIPRPFRALYLVLFLAAQSAIAQPALPDIAGISANGINTLSWTNHTDGVKSIHVLRSSDSVLNFAVIGSVKNLNKGVQTYTDQHPMAGNNWYRVDVIFNPKVTWSSNTIRLYTNSSQLHLSQKNNKPESITTRTDSANKKQKIVIILPADTVLTDAATYFKSKYIHTDPQTGHVSIWLPDVKKYHYMIRFYDNRDRMIVEVPKLQSSPVLLDMRNFQKKGIYHFIIKKDKKTFDEGYVVIN